MRPACGRVRRRRTWIGEHHADFLRALPQKGPTGVYSAVASTWVSQSGCGQDSYLVRSSTSWTPTRPVTRLPARPGRPALETSSRNLIYARKTSPIPPVTVDAESTSWPSSRSWSRPAKGGSRCCSASRWPDEVPRPRVGLIPFEMKLAWNAIVETIRGHRTLHQSRCRTLMRIVVDTGLPTVR